MRRRKAASDDEESDNELPRRRTRDSGSESDSSHSEHSDLEEEETTKSNSPRVPNEAATEETNSANQEPAPRGNNGHEERVPSGRGYRFNHCIYPRPMNYRNFHNKREDDNPVNEIQNLSIDEKRGGRFNRRPGGRQYSRNRDNSGENQNKSGNSPSFKNKNPSVQFRPKQPKQEGSTPTTNEPITTSTSSQEQQQQRPSYQKKYNKQYNGPRHRGNTNEEQTISSANSSTTTASNNSAPSRNYNNNTRTQQGGGYRSKSYTGRRSNASEGTSTSAPEALSSNNAPNLSNISPSSNIVPFNSVDTTSSADSTNTTMPYSNAPYMAAPYPYHPASYGYPYNPYYITTIPTFASHDQGIQYYPLPTGYNPYTKPAVQVPTATQEPSPLSSSSPAFVPGKLAARQRNPIPIIDPNDMESKKQEIKETVNSISTQQESKIQ